MKSLFKSAVVSIAALGTALGAVPVEAQQHGDRGHENRHNDRGWNNHQQTNRGGRQFHYYGGNYGYNGYQGRWRTGQRFTNFRNRQYYVTNYSAYGLPAPRPGYRYYRDSNGDIVMAAIASGVIGLIIGGALSGR